MDGGGTTPIGQTRVYLRRGFNTGGDTMTVHYTKRRNSKAEDLLGNECNTAERWLIDNCHGDDMDSRGGWVTWTTSNLYGVDPQTDKCHC